VSELFELRIGVVFLLIVVGLLGLAGFLTTKGD